MDSMRRNAQKMMPNIMAMNKDPNVGMKNNRQPMPGVSNLTAYAKGGKVMAKGGAADKKQDKSMLSRHNKLMHPGQKSKLMNGGMVNKYAGGGAVDYPSKSKSDYAKQFKSDYANRRKDMLIVTPDNEDYMSGRISGRERQDKAKRDNALNAYANRGKDYIKDKLDDVDVAISKKIGLKERARTKESFREGLKEEGYNTGGKVSKYAGGGMGPMSSAEDRMKAKRGIDPYEDRTRGLPSGSMSDLDAELISKELRQKYGKKENRSVMHPGGRQRFLLNQTEKAPMKRGGKAEASKLDMQQDRALMARHNRLMHPDQKSKMKNGGKSVPSYSSKPLIKKSGGGSYNY